MSIKVAEHSLFQNPGTSIYVKTKLSSRYSEANAGSGEVAVIQLVKKIEEAQEYSLILLDEPEVSIHPGAQEKLKEYLLEVTKRKKLQVVISSHSPILIRDMPSEAIKLYVTNSQGRFEVKENVDYREAFYDLEDCVSDKKIIFCEDFAAKNIVDQVLKRMDKTQYFDVEFNPGGEKTLLTKYLPTFVTHDFFKERVFLVLDGDMQTDYVYNADELTVKQEKDVSYMKECVKKAYGVDVQAYVDGGNGGKREDQEIDAYKEYLKYYTDSVFYLPNKSIPEKILLESQYVKRQYPSIVNENVDITNDNAKKIFATISEADYGNEEHINDLIQKLAYKWSMEDSLNKKRVEEIVNEIYKK
ncbi:MAG: AAA family ATPase [Lachnospiraceae bacterium]